MQSDAQLHLVRRLPPYIDGRKLGTETFFRLARKQRHEGSVIGFWTRRRPTRTVELRDGSVYFVVGTETVFRLPFVEMQRVRDFAPGAAPEWLDAWAIVCEPDATLVESRRVHRLQGWRYLSAEEAPRDIGPPDE